MTVPLKLKITYGTFAVGTGTEDTYRITEERFSIERGRLESSCDFSLVVLSDSPSYADLETKCAALEAYRERQDRLLIEIDGNTVQDYNPSSGYSKNSESSYRLVRESEYNTGWTREYAVSIGLDLPPPESNGRTEMSATLHYDSSRIKTVTIRTGYDATSAGTAMANYTADAAYFTGVLTAFGGGVFDKPEETIETPDIDINTDIVVTLIYKQIIFNQMDGSLDDPDLIGFALTVARNRAWQGDYFGTLPENIPGGPNDGEVVKLMGIVITMNTFVDHTLETDLVAKYDNVIRPYILSYAKQILDVETVAITDEDIVPDPSGNSMAARIVVSAATNGYGQVISASIQTRIKESYGVLLVPVADGSLHGYLRIQTKGQLIRTITQSTSVVGDGATLHLGNPALAGHPGSENSTGWQILGREYVEDPKFIGYVPNADENFPIFESTVVRVEQYVTAVTPIAPVTFGGVGFSGRTK